MKIITKKSYPDLFEKVLTGEKTFDMRVADFDIQPGDILEQIEVNYDGTPTGRPVRHKSIFGNKKILIDTAIR